MSRWNVVKLKTELLRKASTACSLPLPAMNNGLCLCTPHCPPASQRRVQLCTVSDVNTQTKEDEEESFKKLLDSSRFIQCINPVGKVVEANIIAVVGEKLYVDFGSKFHAVVPLPEEDSDRYRVGTKVLARVKDLEMTGHFVGDKRHLSLLEAEAELVGLAQVQRAT